MIEAFKVLMTMEICYVVAGVLAMFGVTFLDRKLPTVVFAKILLMVQGLLLVIWAATTAMQPLFDYIEKL